MLAYTDLIPRVKPFFKSFKDSSIIGSEGDCTKVPTPLLLMFTIGISELSHPVPGLLGTA